MDSDMMKSALKGCELFEGLDESQMDLLIMSANSRGFSGSSIWERISTIDSFVFSLSSFPTKRGSNKTWYDFGVSITLMFRFMR